MKILFSWLKEFLEVSLHPEALAKLLTEAGCEVTSVLPIEGDWLLELEVTPNRPDLLSHLGVAREVAAILGRPFRIPRWLQREFSWEATPQAPEPPVSITIEDTEGCRRYVGICIEGVTVSPSPPSLVRRLRFLGIRPVNNVVDATNACLMELGQPLHAFDLDTLQGPSIRVRRARGEESMVTIDGVKRLLNPGILVIADQIQPVALAGVMGAKDSEISPHTQRVLLESAWFDPALIRHSARSLGVSSESSYRFERGVDPVFVTLAALRAARWIARLSGGRLVNGPIDIGQREIPRTPIRISPVKAQAILGVRIYPAQQRHLLERVGCRVTGMVRGLKVEPPSYRGDLKRPEDLYEELARLWGYDRCPATLAPVSRREVHGVWESLEDPRFTFKAQIRLLLTGAGCQEILTYSLISETGIARCRLKETQPLRILNPLSSEQAWMRPNLLPGFLETLARNIHRKAEGPFQFFELGNVYLQGPKERLALGLLLAGTHAPRFGIPASFRGLFQIKGILGLLFQRLRRGPLTVTVGPGPKYFTLDSMAFRLKKQILGWAGSVDPKVLEEFELPKDLPVAYAQLDMESLVDLPPLPVKVSPLPKVPPVHRDLAVLISEGISHEAVRQVIEASGGPLLKGAILFDLYRGEQIPKGKRSLAFRLSYSAGDRTLTDEEILQVHQRIVEALQARFQAIQR